MHRSAAWCLGLLLAGLGAAPVPAQEVPKATPEGKRDLIELARACFADGGLKDEGEGPRKTLRVDADQLRKTLAARRQLLTPDVRDTLVAGWLEVQSDPGKQNLAAAYLAILEAFGQETRDDRALGFAALFAGVNAERGSQPDEAAAAYQRAAGHFAAAPEPVWQAHCLTNL